MILPYLWKLGSDGNINIWRVYTEDQYEVKVRFKITKDTGINKEPVITSPDDPIEHQAVNVGKSNYMSSLHVAKEKAKRTWTDMKEKKGYTPITDHIILKMLASADYQAIREKIYNELGIENKNDAKRYAYKLKSPYEYESIKDFKANLPTCMTFEPLKNFTSIEFPIIAQTKYDGERFMSGYINGKSITFTRQKKIKDLIPHITKELKILSIVALEIRNIDCDTLDGFWDCEAIGIDNAGNHLSRQKIQAIVSRTVNKHSNSNDVFFIIFDYAIPDTSFKDRLIFLTEIFEDERVKELKYIKLCNTKVIETIEELQEFHHSNIEENYEGTMVKPMDLPYLSRRCTNGMKIKDTYTEEAVIIGADSSRGAQKGCVIWNLISMENGSEYKAVHEANTKKRRKYLEEIEYYIGKIVTVRFFSRTDSGKPSHAIAINEPRNTTKEEYNGLIELGILAEVEGYRDDLE